MRTPPEPYRNEGPTCILTGSFVSCPDPPLRIPSVLWNERRRRSRTLSHTLSSLLPRITLNTLLAVPDRRRGYDVDIPRRRVAATPLLRRGYSAEVAATPRLRDVAIPRKSRGDAAAWIFRRGDATAATWLFRGGDAAAARRGYSAKPPRGGHVDKGERYGSAARSRQHDCRIPARRVHRAPAPT